MHVGDFPLFNVSLDGAGLERLLVEESIDVGVVFHPDNAYVQRVVESLPRVYGLVWANPRVPGYLEETLALLDHPRFVGVKLHPLLDAYHPNDVAVHPLIAALVEIFTIPFFGSLSDRVGRRPILIGGAALLGIWAFPFFGLLNTKSTVLIILATIVGLSIAHAAVYAVQGSFYAELFGTRVRYSGASVSYQVSGIFGGALAPLIATWLYPQGGTTLIAVYVAALCALSVVCYALAAETYRKDIYAEEPQERRLVAERG